MNPLPSKPLDITSVIPDLIGNPVACINIFVNRKFMDTLFRGYDNAASPKVFTPGCAKKDKSEERLRTARKEIGKALYLFRLPVM